MMNRRDLLSKAVVGVAGLLSGMVFWKKGNADTTKPAIVRDAEVSMAGGLETGQVIFSNCIIHLNGGFRLDADRISIVGCRFDHGSWDSISYSSESEGEVKNCFMSWKDAT